MLICIKDCGEDIRILLKESRDVLGTVLAEEIEEGGTPRIQVSITNIPESGYRIAKKENGLEIGYHKLPDLCRALLYAESLEWDTAPELIRESNCFEEFGIMEDLSRNAVLRPAMIKKMLRKAAFMGYTYIGLYMEDTMEVPGEPLFGYMRGRLTSAELKDCDAYAAIFGMELRPYIQTLAHLNQIFQYDEYTAIRDTNDILRVGEGEERTYRLIENIIKAASENFRTRKINIGMDEAHQLGLGSYLDKNGYTNRFDIMLDHLNRVIKICDKYGMKPEMWSDMFFRLAFHGDYYTTETGDSEIPKLDIPESVTLTYWDYYSTDPNRYNLMFKRHLMLTDRIAFAGGAWKWEGFAPLNRFSMAAGRVSIEACKRYGIKNYVLTCWGDNGAECAASAVLPTLFVDSNVAYTSNMPEEAFTLLAGINLNDFTTLDEGNPTAPADTWNSFGKVLFYEDPLEGLFASVSGPDLTEYYLQAAERFREILEFMDEEAEFRYLFETQRCLCKVLAVKAELPDKILKAYRSDNRKALGEMANGTIPALINHLDAFYCAFRKQWNLENKSQGFEVQTIRIGGLRQRLLDVEEILRDYATGVIDSIDELEEERIPYQNCTEYKAGTFKYNRWHTTATTSRLQ